MPEDQKEIKIIKIYDIKKSDEEEGIKDIDISGLYRKENIKIRGLREDNTNDILSNLDNPVHIKVSPVITISPKYNPTDSVSNRKRNIINLGFDYSHIKNQIDLRKKSKIKTDKTLDSIIFPEIYSLSLSRRLKIISDKIKQKRQGSILLFYTSYVAKYILYSLVILIFLFGYKNTLEFFLNSGMKNLELAKNNKTNFAELKKNINDSRFDFIVSDMLLYPIDLLFNNKIYSSEFNRNILNIADTGKNLTKALDKSIYMYESIEEMIKIEGINNIQFSQLLYNSENDIFYIINSIVKSLESINEVKSLGDKDLDNKLKESKIQLSEITTYFLSIGKNYENILNILGHNKKKKYLIIFQNSDEIRPMGGFMGSMAEIDIFRGQIIDFKTKDVYAYEWDIKPYRETPPEGINKITDSFGLRDANYFIDIGDSSEKIKFFMEKAGVDIDGIIYINQNIILELLDLVGPVYFDQIDREIDSDNFSTIISTLVEAKVSKEGTLGTPKQILFDFIREDFFTKIKEKGDYKSLINFIQEKIKNRDLSVYLFDELYRNTLEELKIYSFIKYDTIDYAYPVYTSISGNKSDRYIDRKYSKTISIREDCSIDTDLTLRLKHNFNINEELKIKQVLYDFGINDTKTMTEMVKIQGKGANNEFVRIVLPANAIIKSNVKNYKEGDNTIVSFYLWTDPMNSREYTIRYSLPNPDCRDYRYRLYKQPGISEYDIEINQGGKIVEEKGIKGDFLYR